MILSLLFLLTVNAGMDRHVVFDFDLSPEHRGAIALNGSIMSDLPPEKVGVVWKQLTGPKAFITQPDRIRPFALVDTPGAYRFMVIAGDGKELVNDSVTFTVESRKDQK